MPNDILAFCGIESPKGNVMYDASPAVLVEEALARREAQFSSTGSVVVNTGRYTGRSPKDRFIVDTPDVHDRIAWGPVNMPFTIEGYEAVKKTVIDYLTERDLFVVRAYAGASRAHARKFCVVCEKAAQALFVHQLLVRPTAEEMATYGDPDFVVLAAPDLKLDPEVYGTHSEAVVLINFAERMILVAGSAYAGEIKKSIFSVMNYLLPTEDGVLPMHSSCNADPETGETCVFFGLSGTGKTTLSADPNRMLVGDDEHGWADEGVFNMEGGCYAKAINITRETEPLIFDAIKFGSYTENVIIDPETRTADYFDGSLTENTRTAYPVEYIPNAELTGCGAIPSVVIFLTADAFGVLPPISRLDKNAAMYHFISGFTSKVAGTERGIKEPTPTFSTLFGEPFMPLDPLEYTRMFGERMEKYHTRVYLINTGWSGGAYGTGQRMKLKYTRAMVTAALSGEIEESEFIRDEVFNVDVPKTCPGVPSSLLIPRNTWRDKDEFDMAANNLARMFAKNCEEKYPDMTSEVRNAGPKAG